MLLYIVEFFIFAFLGWILDSLYCSLISKKLIASGYFRGIPLCPIYGFGGILLINSFAFLVNQPSWVVIFLTTLFIVILEYVGGWLAEHLLDEKLWDYSKEPFNLGYISLWHSFLWLLLITGLYYVFGQNVVYYLTTLENKVNLNNLLEVFLFFLLLMGTLFLTSHHKKLRLSKLAQQRFANGKDLRKK